VDEAGHALKLNLPDEPVYLEADPVRVAQVISNLLNNAAKYTESEGRITLDVRLDGDWAVVSVEDNGIGIASEHLPRIFEMFSQEAPAINRSQGGLGIGLSLVKGLVELHGGIVRATSPGPGKGSRFEVRLPLADAVPRHDGEGCRTALNGSANGKCRVLVVDDNRDHAESLGMLLEITGNDARTAFDGLEGLRVADQFRPEVILLDIGMPKLNGYETARRIRKKPWGQDVLLVALTGWGQEQDKRMALEAGFDHHLTKPVDSETLAKILSSVRCGAQSSQIE
jgi:CheY-like chemotaxis protein